MCLDVPNNNIEVPSPATLDIPGIDLLKDGRSQVYSNTSAKKKFYSPISPCWALPLKDNDWSENKH